MIPPLIVPGTKSGAERLLFNTLQNCALPESYYCFHSVNLPDHIYKVYGELDFVIVGPRGIYVIEVKGGGVTCRNGIWYFENKIGEIAHSSEGPFHQARSGMHSLRDRLLQALGKSELAQVVMGYGVAFPQCEFAVQGVEWEQELVLDARRLRTQGIARYIKALEIYWHRKFPNIGPLSATSVKRLVQAMRPEFELVPALYVQASEIDARLERLTEEQYDKLDLVEYTPRLLVQGGAGTGKTFLATEIVRRHGLRDERTLLVCFSPLLAGFLANRIQVNNVVVISVHELMFDLVRRFGQLPDGYKQPRDLTDPWFLNELVPAFERAAQHIPDKEMFDVLVVDEAQDILNYDYLAALGYMLRGGLEQGKWRIFYDAFNQGAIFGAIDPEVIRLLEEYQTCGVTKLRINCRNTDEIVLQTKLTTGADLGVTSTGPGPEVVFNYYNNSDEAVSLLQNYLDTLVKKQIDEREITILSPRPYDQSTASRLSESWRKHITVLTVHPLQPFSSSGITFATIAHFKGLENRFIALTDIDDLDADEAARAILYVGMSRAKVSLWIAMQQHLRHKQETLALQYLPSVIEDLQRDR